MRFSRSFLKFPRPCYRLILQNGLKTGKKKRVFFPAPPCISCQNAADDVVRCIREHQKNKNSVLILNNPGHASYVRQFYDSGVEHVVCTNMKENQSSEFKELFNDQKIWYSPENFMSLSKSQIEESILNQLPVQVHDVGMTIVSTLQQKKNPGPHKSVFSLMSNKCISYPGLFDTDKTEFFIFVTDRNYKVMNTFFWLYSHKIYRAFFHLNHIMELKSTDFNPPMTTHMITTDEVTPVHLVHMTPNQNILPQLTVQERKEFKKFVQLCLKTDTIITFLEKLQPGCGIHLIKKGFTMNDENITLTAEQYFRIFKIIRHLPGYEESTLHLMIVQQDSKNKQNWADMHTDYG